MRDKIDETKAAGQFLIDRLEEFEGEIEGDWPFVQYNGHVVPAISRLRAALASPLPVRDETAVGTPRSGAVTDQLLSDPSCVTNSPAVRESEVSTAPITLVPDGDPVALDDCPEGLFIFGKTLAVMTEYATEAKSARQRDAYIVDSGEYFWGGTCLASERAKLLVQPLVADAHPLPAAAEPGVVEAAIEEFMVTLQGYHAALQEDDAHLKSGLSRAITLAAGFIMDRKAALEAGLSSLSGEAVRTIEGGATLTEAIFEPKP